MPAYAPVTFTGNGTTGPYFIPWSYISQDDVHVFVNDVEVGFTWLNPAVIQLAAPASIGASGLIKRITPGADPLIDWLNGTNINEENLDANTRQLLFLIQESDAFQGEEAVALATAAAAVAQAAAADALAAVAATSSGDCFFFR